MGGAVVDDPEDAPGGCVGLLGHHLVDEPVERFDPALGLAAVEQLCPPHVPAGQVAERALPLVLVLDQLAVAAGEGRQRPVETGPRLDRRLLVGAEHELARVEQLALEATGVKIEHPRRLRPEVGVAGEDPGAVVPGADRVFCQPAPDRGPRYLLDDPARDGLARDLAATEAGERKPALARQLAGDRLHLGHHLGGKSAAADPLGDGPPTPAAAPRGSASASGSPPPWSCPGAARSRRSRAPRQPAARSSLVAPPGRPASAAAPADPAHAPRSRSARSGTESSPCRRLRHRRSGPFTDRDETYGRNH